MAFSSSKIDLRTAENRVSARNIRWELFVQDDGARDACSYPDSSYGTATLRAKLAAFFNEYFTNHADAVNRDHIVVATGAGPAIGMLARSFCNPGDELLVHTPTYSRYETILSEFDVRLRYAPTQPPQYRPSVADLDRTWKSASKTERERIKGVLLTSPGNPTGHALWLDEYVGIVRWARDKRMHVICNEVYALSLHYDAPELEFCQTRMPMSVLRALHGRLEENVHVVWAFSKDFCLPGMNVGCLISQNEDIITTCRRFAGNTSRVSVQTQTLLANVLSDRAFLDEYIPDNQSRLQDSKSVVQRYLTELGIPFIEPSGGLFFWICLKDYLQFFNGEGDDASREGALVKYLESYNCAGVMIDAGAKYRSHEPGWYRCCFGAAREELVCAWNERIGPALQSLRNKLPAPSKSLTYS